MKALVFEKAGRPENVLSLREIDAPSPAQGEVLVRIDARPIQPSDFMFIGGSYRWKPQFPQTAGLEGAGVIAAVGPGVSLPVGERVAFRSPGAWAEYGRVPAERLYRVPSDIATENAAQFPLNPVTAWALLVELHLQPGDWIAINAATSVVAHIAESLARRRKVGVVGIVRPGSQARVSFPAIPADAPEIAAKILAITGGALLAGYLDSVGGMLVKNVLPALRQGATIVSYGLLEQAPAPILNSDLIYRNLSWKGFGIDHWLATSGDRRDGMTTDLWSAIRDGGLPLPVRARYRLEDFRSALADVATTDRSGKVLLTG